MNSNFVDLKPPIKIYFKLIFIVFLPEPEIIMLDKLKSTEDIDAWALFLTNLHKITADT